MGDAGECLSDSGTVIGGGFAGSHSAGAQGCGKQGQIRCNGNQPTYGDGIIGPANTYYYKSQDSTYQSQMPNQYTPNNFGVNPFSVAGYFNDAAAYSSKLLSNGGGSFTLNVLLNGQMMSDTFRISEPTLVSTMEIAGKVAYGLTAGAVIYENWGKHSPANIAAKVAVSGAELYVGSGIAVGAATGTVVLGGGPEDLPADGVGLATFVLFSADSALVANQYNQQKIFPGIDSYLP